MSVLCRRAGETEEIHQLLFKKRVNGRRDLSCLLWNACSLNKKLNDFTSLLEDEDLDVAAITETWMASQLNNVTAELRDKGYNIYHFNRDDRIGGGVALIYKSTYTFLSGKTFKCQHL